ncbi:MAG: ABC transporter substrate-binding protein, partial [Agrobacterium fabrum]
MRIAILIAALLAAGTSLAAERSVTDAAGRTVSVPEKPQRIVVMHEPLLGVPLMDLDANVVGAYGRNSDGKFATAVDFVDTVLGEGRTKPKGFGAVGQIDLEKLRALQPDLIVATEMDGGK